MRLNFGFFTFIFLMLIFSCNDNEALYNNDVNLMGYIIRLPYHSSINYYSIDSFDGIIEIPNKIKLDFNIGSINVSKAIDSNFVIYTDSIDNIVNITTRVPVSNQMNDICVFSISLVDTESMIMGKRNNSLCIVARNITEDYEEDLIHSFRNIIFLH